MPAAAARHVPDRMSGRDFRSFQEGRPDHERWELVEGVPVMMTPPLMEHNRIASNLENLLNEALAEHDPTRIAVQRPGIEFPWPPAVLADLRKADYRPEPDVAVVNYDDAIAGVRFTDTAYFLAEVLSSTDEDLTPISGEPWIDVKVRLYQAHGPCEAILLAEQGRMFVKLHVREAQGWAEHVFADADARVELPTMGLSCRLGEIYADTRWQPRPSRTRQP